MTPLDRIGSGAHDEAAVETLRLAERRDMVGPALDRAIRALRRIASGDQTAMPRQAHWRAFAAQRALAEINAMLKTRPDTVDGPADG